MSFRNLSLSIECVLAINEVAAKDMWLLLSSARSDVLRPDLLCELYGCSLAIRDVDDALAAESKPYFTVEFENGSLDYGPLGAYGISRLQISSIVESVEDASKWMAPILTSPFFVQGRLFDDDYEFLQNATDPLEFRARSLEYRHLPMKSNRLPPPLERLVIDTSSNPGRRALRRGYIEAVGSPMWLTSRILSEFDIADSELRSNEWLGSELLPSGVWKIAVRNSPFDSSTGEQGRLQDRLRDFLFGRKESS